MIGRRLLAAGRLTAAGRLLVAGGLGVLGALGVAGSAAADPATPTIAVATVTPSAGQVRLILTGTGLTDPTALAAAKVTVSADGTDLPVTVASTRNVPEAELPPRSVIVVLDTSASMAGAALTGAEVAAFGLADALAPDVSLGLVAVSDTARTVLEPTRDRAAFRSAAGQLAAAGHRALYDGVRTAAGLVGQNDLEHRVVLVTAGPDDGSKTTAAQAASALQPRKIPLDVVSSGPVRAGAAVTGLATGSGGRATDATDGAALTKACQAAAGRLSALAAATATVPAQLAGKTATLTVTADVGGKQLTTSTPDVAFVAVPAGLPQLRAFTLNALPKTLLFVAFGSLALAITVAVFAVAYLLGGRSGVARRLQQLERFGAGADRGAAAPVETPDGSALMRTALALSERAVQRQGRSGIEIGLDRAGLALRPAEWMLIRAGVAAGGAFVGVLLLPWYLGVPIGLGGGWLLSAWYRKSRATRRARKFGDLLPDALQLVVGALRSGFSLSQAIDAVVREGPEPVAGEFGRATAEIRLGGDLEDALERTAERNGSADLAWLVMAIRIQREVGGNLSEVLETAVETMRERGRLKRHVRALSAEGRLSAYVLIGMPIALSLYLFFFRPDYVRPLFTQALGLVMLGASGALLVLGAFVISRIVKVEV